MGTIIFLVYLAGVAGGVQFLLGFCGGVAIVWMLFVMGVTRIEDWRGQRPDNPFTPKKSWVAMAMGSVLIATLIPSKETLYAAAALVAGDRVLASETGGKALAAVNAWLDEQTEGDEEEKK